MKSISYIYKITNIVNNKIYIGKTNHSDPYKRFEEHKRESMLNRNKTNNRPLYRAMRKYGIDNFMFEIIKQTDKPEEDEMYYIKLFDTYKNGYNATLGGDGKRYLSLNESEIIKSFYKNKKSVRKTAQDYNVDPNTIREILNSNKIETLSLKEIMNEINSRSILKIDKEGNIVASFDSIKEASFSIINKKSETARKNISRAVNSNGLAYGYKWIYKLN